jgi:hypothetical protein
MRSTFKFAAIAASATLLAGASSASATVLVATWTGTVPNGYDYTGVFGSVGSLDGDTFVVKYTYNTSVGIRETHGLAGDEVFGGPTYASYGVVASPVSATITINGHTSTSNGDNQGLAATSPSSSDFVQDVADQDDTIASGYIYNNIYSNAHGIDQPTLDTPVPLTDVLPTAFGYASIVTFNNSTGYTRDAYAYLNTETVQIGIGSVSAIPEPAAWALMLSGLGFIGGGIRGRRRAASLA